MSKRKPRPAGEGADDLEILHPERELQIAGVKVVMREYGFIEGLRLAGAAAPVVQGLAALTGDDVAGGLLDYARLQAVFAEHADAVTGMVAQACDRPRAWVEGLNDADGQALLLAWWAANGPFFVRRVAVELQMRLTVAAESAGATSTPASPPPATAMRPPSGAAPAVN